MSPVWRAVALALGTWILWKELWHVGPVSIEPGIPEKIWQTWPKSLTLMNETERRHVVTWTHLQPHFRHELLSDEAAAQFIRTTYVDRQPDSELVHIGKLYLSLHDAILRADFLRYLILYARGGFYADVDVACLRPIADWTELDTISVILGIESDRQPVVNDWKLYTDYRRYIWGLNNWTLASRAKHPLFRIVIRQVAANLEALARRKEVSVEELRGGMDGNVGYKDVIDATGPLAFTRAFLIWKGDGCEDLKMLEQPKLLKGNVLIMPIRAMSVSEADREDGEGARALSFGDPVLRHWSEGSWKRTHPITYGTKPDWWE